MYTETETDARPIFFDSDNETQFCLIKLKLLYQVVTHLNAMRPEHRLIPIPRFVWVQMYQMYERNVSVYINSLTILNLIPIIIIVITILMILL